MKKTLASLVALLATTSAALAVPGISAPKSVPEISALDGTAALAAVVAVVLLVWERRRRAA